MKDIIVVNSVIQWITENELQNLERILWIDQKRQYCFVVNLSDKKNFPQLRKITDLEEAINDGKAIRRTTDPFLKLLSDEESIPERHRLLRDKAWNIIKDIVIDEPGIYLAEKRGQLVKDTALTFKIHKMTVYDYLRKYWIWGKTRNSLLPHYDKCGAPGKVRKANQGIKRGRPKREIKIDPDRIGVNVTEADKKIFRRSIALYFNNKKDNSLKDTYDLMIENFYNVGFRNEDGVQIPILPPAYEYPSLGQFKYWYYRENDLKKSQVARYGEKGYNQRHRPKLGSSTQMALGPGSIYQIDATIVGVYLVSSFDPTLIIGKPVLYLIIDVYSHMIVGIYVGLEGPSWVGAKMALANATTEKVSFCAKYGIEISEEQWPSKYLPDSVLGDRGEMEGYNSDSLVNYLNITAANTPPYRPDWKPIIEQSFDLAEERTVKWIPGAVKERYRERGEKDHRLDAKLDIYKFTKILIYYILEYNANQWIKDYRLDEAMIRDRVKPIPIELWNWGFQNRSGHLREADPQKILYALMPKGQAVVTESGIRFNGVFYTSEKALQEQWYEKARAYGRWNVDISYDSRNMDTIYLHSGKNDFIPCQLLEREKRYKGRFFEEILDLHELEKISCELHRSASQQSTANLHAKIDGIVKEAEQQAELFKTNQISNNQRIKNIKQNRDEEKKAIQGKEVWRPEKDNNPTTTQAEILKFPNLDKEDDTIEDDSLETVSQQKSFLNMLKKQRTGEDKEND